MGSAVYRITIVNQNDESSTTIMCFKDPIEFNNYKALLEDNKEIGLIKDFTIDIMASKFVELAGLKVKDLGDMTITGVYTLLKSLFDI